MSFSRASYVHDSICLLLFRCMHKSTKILLQLHISLADQIHTFMYQFCHTQTTHASILTNCYSQIAKSRILTRWLCIKLSMRIRWVPMLSTLKKKGNRNIDYMAYHCIYHFINTNNQIRSIMSQNKIETACSWLSLNKTNIYREKNMKK